MIDFLGDTVRLGQSQSDFVRLRPGERGPGDGSGGEAAGVQRAVDEEDDPRPSPQHNRPSYDDVDRVLEKISATGLESLTPDERRLLDDMSPLLRKR